MRASHQPAWGLEITHAFDQETLPPPHLYVSGEKYRFGPDLGRPGGVQDGGIFGPGAPTGAPGGRAKASTSGSALSTALMEASSMLVSTPAPAAPSVRGFQQDVGDGTGCLAGGERRVV